MCPKHLPSEHLQQCLQKRCPLFFCTCTTPGCKPTSSLQDTKPLAAGRTGPGLRLGHALLPSPAARQHMFTHHLYWLPPPLVAVAPVLDITHRWAASLLPAPLSSYGMVMVTPSVVCTLERVKMREAEHEIK